MKPFTTILFILSVSLTALSGCGTTNHSAPPAPGQPVYANAELVSVSGYSGPMQDPVPSPDGAVLFFDSHNDGGLPSHLYWAKLLSYKSFQFMGPVGGVNEYTGASQTTLRGNYDTNGTFYFAYDDSLTQHNGVYIAKGAWSNGTVTNITPLRGITSSTNITFDVYISPAGNTLVSDYVVLSWFHRPASSTIFGASKNPDGSFTPWANSGAIFATLNSIPGRPLVYNPSLTPDGLTVFVTAAPSQPGFRVPVTYAATRASGLEPFGTPVLVDAINNPGEACAGKFSEMGGVSPDGKHLYFHRWTGKTTDLLCVLTRQ